MRIMSAHQPTSECGERVMKWILLLLLCVAGEQAQAQKFEALAKTPPMGWNSWNKFACNVNERLIRETADAMVSTGMKDAGYQFVNVDDCWHGSPGRPVLLRPRFLRLHPR